MKNLNQCVAVTAKIPAVLGTPGVHPAAATITPDDGVPEDRPPQTRPTTADRASWARQRRRTPRSQTSPAAAPPSVAVVVAAAVGAPPVQTPLVLMERRRANSEDRGQARSGDGEGRPNLVPPPAVDVRIAMLTPQRAPTLG